MKLQNFLLGSIFLLAVFATRPLSAGLIYSIEPVVGYERVQKLLPTPHMRQRLVYGARLTAGIFMLSGEAEILRGTDTESFLDTGTIITDTEDKLRVGVRARFRLVQLLSFILRGGAQASRNVREETIAGVTTRTEDPIRYSPYLGAGLQVGLSSNISFTADLTTVFRNFPNLNDNEYQTTASLTIRFP